MSIESGAATWNGLSGIARMATVCLSGRGGALDCQPLWTGLMIALGVVALGVILFIVRHILKDFLQHRAANKRWQADQVVASKDVMEQAKWSGEQSVASSETEQELAARIKRALEENRARQRE